jgi:hypothetical protein
MALKNVDSGNRVSSTKMEVGAKVTGYVLGFVDGQYGPNIEMQDTKGETFTLLAAKHIQYKIADKKIKVGLYTEITRLADKKANGKTASQFTVEQDADRTIDVVDELTAAGITSDVAAPAAVSSIKEKAAKLAAQVK